MDHPIFSRIEKALKPDFADVLTDSFDLVKLTNVHSVFGVYGEVQVRTG